MDGANLNAILDDRITLHEILYRKRRLKENSQTPSIPTCQNAIYFITDVPIASQSLAQQKSLSLTKGSALHPWSFGLIWPRLTPHSTSYRLAATVAQPAYCEVSPGNAHPPSRLCPPHLHTYLPVRYRTLEIYASSSGMHASYAVPVRRASVLPSASFLPHLAMTQLPFS